MEKKDATFLTFILIMLLIKVLDTAINPVHVFPGRTASFPIIELVAVVLCGYISLILSSKIYLPEMWTDSVSDRQRLVYPFIIGITCGLAFWVFDYYARIGDMSVGFPMSLPFYLWGAVSTEILMHIFPFTVILYFSRNARHKDTIFYSVAFLLSGLAAMSMAAAFSIPDIPITASSNYIIIIAGVMVFITELLIMYLYKRYGMLAPVSMRLGFYVMWHIIWPLLFY